MKQIIPLSIVLICGSAHAALASSSHGGETAITHMKWMPVVALGYAASIFVHIFINSRLF